MHGGRAGDGCRDGIDDHVDGDRTSDGEIAGADPEADADRIDRSGLIRGDGHAAAAGRGVDRRRIDRRRHGVGDEVRGQGDADAGAAEQIAAPPVNDLMLDMSSALTVTSPPATMSDPSETCASTVLMMPLIASAAHGKVFGRARRSDRGGGDLAVEQRVVLGRFGGDATAPVMPVRLEFSMGDVIVLVTEFQPSEPPKPLPLKPIATAPPMAWSTESSCASIVTDEACVSVEPAIRASSVLMIRLTPMVNAAESSLPRPSEMPTERRALSFFAESQRAPDGQRRVVDRRERVAGDLVEPDREADAEAPPIAAPPPMAMIPELSARDGPPRRRARRPPRGTPWSRCGAG